MCCECAGCILNGVFLLFAPSHSFANAGSLYRAALRWYTDRAERMDLIGEDHRHDPFFATYVVANLLVLCWAGGRVRFYVSTD
jgi:hypothetical protein